ncbi:unnamed protein product [Mytilus coruscus]|uniref:Uncharacterized protein n=1 Tax=Mytilus coruscus TaxID=42192 RepID=A0A6J8EZB3_MYTCO|nr:unnamed protein product [Mytilus coruscus]
MPSLHRKIMEQQDTIPVEGYSISSKRKKAFPKDPNPEALWVDIPKCLAEEHLDLDIYDEEIDEMILEVELCEKNFVRNGKLAEMSKAEPNVYLNNIFVEGKTDDDAVYEECFDTDDQSDYEEVSPVAKNNPSDINIAHNIPKNQSIQEDNSRSKKMHVQLRLLVFISCFVITLVVSNVVTFITTKNKFSEKKTKLTPCAELNCLNGGSCEVSNGMFHCSCDSGFSGRLCEVTPCTGISCLNGGSCEVLNGTFHCSCDSGFSGRLCEEEVGQCFPNPCFNFGSCRASCNTYTCYCPNGTKGSRCQDVLHEIITSPGYPSNYDHGMRRQWNIDVGLAHTVKITFTHFGLEDSYDFLRIYNGQSSTCGSLANYTGTIQPTELTTTGRYMSILFTSDGSNTGLGFRAVIYKINNLIL